MELKLLVEKAWEDRSMLQQKETAEGIREVVEQLDKGKLRVAEPNGNAWM
jgi:2,3,4,5-tetrahydropyridine-2-carboxylate N-succinyltransferase